MFSKTPTGVISNPPPRFLRLVGSWEGTEWAIIETNVLTICCFASSKGCCLKPGWCFFVISLFIHSAPLGRSRYIWNSIKFDLEFRYSEKRCMNLFIYQFQDVSILTAILAHLPPWRLENEVSEASQASGASDLSWGLQSAEFFRASTADLMFYFVRCFFWIEWREKPRGCECGLKWPYFEAVETNWAEWCQRAFPA